MDRNLEAHYGAVLGLAPPWRVKKVDLDMSAMQIRIAVEYPAGVPLKCPERGCNHECRLKDHREERSWRHLDTMQFETVIQTRIPRSDCPEHGVKTISIPWACPRSPFTLLFERLAIEVILGARSLSQAQSLLRLSWDQVQRIQELAVERGLARRELDTVEYVGIDEKSFKRGQSYISVMSDLEKGRVLDVVSGRKKTACDELWLKLPEEQRGQIKAVALDMWEAFMNSSREHAPQAELVHDKFHVAKYLGKAVDDVRKQENRELCKQGNEGLKGTKYLWLKKPANWSDTQKEQFNQLRTEQLKVAKAWAVKESFTHFWQCESAYSAEGYFNRWHFWATHSQLRPVIEVAKLLKRHWAGLASYFKHRITNAVAEGLNSKIQSIKANARGFRNFEHYRISILFHCGKLALYP
jgi:transposase